MVLRQPGASASGTVVKSEAGSHCTGSNPDLPGTSGKCQTESHAPVSLSAT